MPLPQAPVGARRILGRWWRTGWFWCCGKSCWWCSRPNGVVQRVQVGGGGRPVREGNKVVVLLLKPSLGLFGIMGRRQVLQPHPGSGTGHLIAPGDHHTLQHIHVHFGVDFQADFEDVRWHDVALSWNHTKDHNRHPVHTPVIRGNPDLYFVGAGNGPVVITWIGREHELYSGASPILLVEHCVTFRHDRRLLSLLGFLHNWPTSRWSATKKRKPVFIKRKCNHVVFSRVTILSFHPIYIYMLSSTDRLFRCIITLQCSQTRDTLQAGIETRLNLRQADDILLSQACDLTSDWEFNTYVLTFVCFHFALSDTRVLDSCFVLREWQPLIPSLKY